MRKIRVTESQYRHILESEFGYPLDVKGDDDKPENFAGYEVAVDNTLTGNNEIDNDVTTSDAVKRSKPGWFGMNRYPAMHRLPEGVELDNKQNSGFGIKYDAKINSIAKNGKGKMASHISSEIESGTRGSRHNTNQVRVSRMETYKDTDPETYAKNGGDEMLKILKSQVKKTSDSNKSADFGKKTKNTNPNAESTSNGGENKSGNGVIYFK